MPILIVRLRSRQPLDKSLPGRSVTNDIMVPETTPPEEIKEIWIARNCAMHRDAKGDKRRVITKPYEIFSKQLTDELITYADFQTLGRPGVVASRAQVISDAVKLIGKFPEPQFRDPADLQQLKDDLNILSAEDVKGKSAKSRRRSEQ